MLIPKGITLQVIFNSMKQTFGEWLKDRLADARISQTELARMVGVEPAQISRLVAGVRGAYFTTTGSSFRCLLPRQVRLPDLPCLADLTVRPMPVRRRQPHALFLAGAPCCVLDQEVQRRALARPLHFPFFTGR